LQGGRLSPLPAVSYAAAKKAAGKKRTVNDAIAMLPPLVVVEAVVEVVVDTVVETVVLAVEQSETLLLVGRLEGCRQVSADFV